MCYGSPVVATKIPGSGLPWRHGEGRSGGNVEPRNPQALADGILKAVGNAEFYGKGAKELFQERFTLPMMIDNTLKIYEETK